MTKKEKNIREATDKFVCENQEIANQIISDLVQLMAEQDADPKLLSENEVALGLLKTIYNGDAVKRLHDVLIKNY